MPTTPMWYAFEHWAPRLFWLVLVCACVYAVAKGGCAGFADRTEPGDYAGYRD